MLKKTSSVNSAYDPLMKRYPYPLFLMSMLMLLVGFMTVQNDVLVPVLKNIFSLSYVEAMLIPFCFFCAYFIGSVPAGRLLTRLGYKNTLLTGLLTAMLGCLLFYPAVYFAVYVFFLLALFVLAMGITILQVAVNPYVSILGPEHLAASRLNLGQGLNSFGMTLGPFFAGVILLSPIGISAGAEAVKIQYYLLASLLFIALCVVILSPLPEFKQAEQLVKSTDHRKIWQAKQTLFGAVAMFFYVGAEVGIGSFLIIYFEQHDIGNMPALKAAHLVSYYWGGIMVGRFIGSIVTRYIKPQWVLSFNCTVAIIFLVSSMMSRGELAIWFILAVGLCNSVIMPTVFSLALTGLYSHRAEGSGLLCLAIVGGGIMPLIQGVIADFFGVQLSFIVPALSYVVVICFAVKVGSLTEKWRQLVWHKK